MLFAPLISHADDCIGAERLRRIADGLISSSPDEAERKLREALELCPESTAVHYGYASALYFGGKQNQAKRELKKIISKNSKHAASRNALAFILINEGKADEALPLAREAVSLDPGNKEFLDTLSKAEGESYPPNLTAKIRVKDHNGNNLLEAGESAVALISLKNSGKGNAREVKAACKLEKDLAGLSVSQGGTISIIPPGEEVESYCKLASTEEDLVSGELKLKIEITEKRGFGANPAVVTMRTQALLPPDLKVVDVGIDDQSGNGQIEPAEIVEVTARVQNMGTGEARSVKATVILGQGLYKAGDSKLEHQIGNLAPGEYKDVIFSMYSSGAAEAIDVSLSLSEERPRFSTTPKLDLAFNRPEKKIAMISLTSTAAPLVSTGIAPATGLSIDVDIPPAGEIERKHPVAVIIGNRRYRNKGVPEVEFAHRDAAVMKKYLIRTMGYSADDIIFQEDALLSDFNRIFGTETTRGQLSDWVRPGESDVFVYYVGHGAPNTNNKSAYFVPSDANPDYIATSGYPLDLFWKNLGNIPAKSLTVVLDTCFSGNSEKGYILNSMSPALLQVDAKFRGPEGSVVMTSGSENQISSWYPSKKHSLFTYFWLKGIGGAADADGNLQVTVGEMENYLAEEVKYAARREKGRDQTPVITSDDDSRVLTTLKGE